MKKKPAPHVVTLDPLVLRLSMPAPRLVAGWPRSEEPPRRIRAAQAARGDFTQLSYIGVPTDVALQRLEHHPDRTAVDDIRDALQKRDRRPFLLAAKLYPYANLTANADFVAVIQDLQTSARAGDQWAKATLKAFGEALGAVGQGQTAAASREEQRQRRRAQTAQAIAIRRRQRMATQLLAEIRDKEHQLRKKGWQDAEARDEAVRSVLSDWKASTGVKNPASIFALLKTLLRS